MNHSRSKLFLFSNIIIYRHKTFKNTIDLAFDTSTVTKTVLMCDVKKKPNSDFDHISINNALKIIIDKKLAKFKKIKSKTN